MTETIRIQCLFSLDGLKTLIQSESRNRVLIDEFVYPLKSS